MNKQQGFGAIGIMVAVVVIAAVGGGGWYVYKSQNKPKPAASKPVVVAKTKKPTVKAPAVAPISDSLKANIAASIESKNTAALEGYMASSVTVVLAASEKGGAVSPMQAVSDLDYLSSGTSPWNFALASDTLAAYKAGSYGQYFGDRTVVGKSANDYIVSFHVNDSGKIDVIFMAANASLL